MLVHFASLVDGNQKHYKDITNKIVKLGHTLVTKHYLSRTIPEIENETPEESQKFHSKFISWMKKADVIVYEMTKQDINAGYEISHALSMNKPVIMLYEKNKCKTPYVFKGIKSEMLQIIEYEINDIEYYLREALDLAAELLNVRYNLFITARQNHFLCYLSEKKMLSKSSVVRRLINEAMIKEKYVTEHDLASSYEIE